MAAIDRAAPKSSKWFSNKALKLSFHRRSTSKSPPPSSSSCKNNSRETDQLREVFRHFDGDGDGKISALEIRAYFGSIGEYMSHEAAKSVIVDLDSDGDNLLDFEDFLRLMKAGDNHGHENDGDEDLKMAFEMFKLEKGSECITPRGLQRMLNRLGDEKSYEECVAMISVFDMDGNGVLDFHEFHQMMTVN